MTIKCRKPGKHHIGGVEVEYDKSAGILAVWTSRCALAFPVCHGDTVQIQRFGNELRVDVGT